MQEQTQKLLDELKYYTESDYLNTNPVDLANEYDCSVTEIWSSIRFLVRIDKIGAISDEFGLVGLYLK
jgi:hypothetical protein